MFNAEFWTAVEAIATAVGALFLIVAIWQFREERKARTLNSFLAVLDTIDSPEMRQLRGKILREFPDVPGQLSEEQYNEARLMWTSLDRVGIMVKHRLVSKELLFDYMAGSIVNMWNKLEPHIEHERSSFPIQGEKPRLKDFEHLFHEAKRYLADK